MPSSNDRWTDIREDLVPYPDLHRALIQGIERADDERERWNAATATAGYVLAAARGLRPVELRRLTVADVSLFWDVLVPRAKRTTRGADARLIPLLSIRPYLAPLVEGLRRTGQRKDSLLTEWQDGRLEPLSPSGLRSLAARVAGLPLSQVPEVRRYRHWYATQREALDSEAAAQPSGRYVSQRRRSASMGHGQSGGWSIYLPNDLVAEATALATLDPTIEPAIDLAGIIFLPPRVDSSRAKAHGAPRTTPRLRPSDWVTTGIDDPLIELDALPIAHARLWSFQWARALGLDRPVALSVALALQAIGFDDALVEPEDLERTGWKDLQLAGDGMLASIPVRGAVGRLQVWLGPAQRLLLDQLREFGPASPFSNLDPGLLNSVVAYLFDRPVTLADLRQANLLVHLLTHTTEQIAYLQGRISHKIRAESAVQSYSPRSVLSGEQTREVVDPNAAPMTGRSGRFNVLAPLHGALRRRSDRLNRAALDHLLDEVLPEWPTWSTFSDGALAPALVIRTLRICVSAQRRDGRRSRSPHTLRWLLEELTLIAEILDGRPVSQLSAEDVADVLGNRRAEERVGAALKWLRAACRAAAIGSPRAFHLRKRRRFHAVDLPAIHDLLRVEEYWDGSHHVLLPLVLVACQVARISEIGQLTVADVILDKSALSLLIRRAKGGRPAYRTVRFPVELRDRISEFGAYFRTRDPLERLIEPLAARSATTEAIFRRIRYRLRRLGLDWSPHLTRSIAASERDRAGMDHADISAGLGHVLVDTATTSYVPIDPMDIAARGQHLADRYDTQLPASAIELVLGVSTRHAAATRASTGGSLKLIALRPTRLQTITT